MTVPPVPQIPTDSPYFGTSGAGQPGYCPEGNARNRRGRILFFGAMTDEMRAEAGRRARLHFEAQIATTGAGNGTARLVSAWFRYEQFYRRAAEAAKASKDASK